MLGLVLAGPELPVRGTITTHVERGDALSGTGWVAYGSLAPTDQDLSRLVVWRDGPRLRVELPDGTPRLVVGDGAAWSFEPRRDTPLQIPARNAAVPLVSVDLLTRSLLERSTDRAAGVRLDALVRRGAHLGRPTWAATLLRANGLEPVHLQVDAETGLVLSERTDGGTVVEWSSFVVGETPEPALFTWDGPSRSDREEQRTRREEAAALGERRRHWFTEHVAAGPLEVGVRAELFGVDVLDEDTGAVRAIFGHGSVILHRRPRSDQAWSVEGERWSTEQWDWAVHVRGGVLSTGSVVALRAQLPDR